MSDLRVTEAQFRQMGLRDLEKCAAEAERLITKRTEEMFELAGLIRQLDHEAFQRISAAVKAELARGGADGAESNVHTDEEEGTGAACS